jgi:hypothetical protein
MKTFLKVGLLGLLILLLAGYFIGAYAMGSVVKAGVNKVGPRITQSKVELAGANISPLTGSGTLTGLAVGNPQGWSDANAFFLGKVSIKLEPKSVFGDTIVIDEIIIDQPEFLYETKFVTSNIKDLLKNIEQAVGGGKEIGAEKEGPAKKLIVKKLRLTNGKATLGVGGTALPVPLPEISLNDLGVKEGGLTGAQLAAAVMRDVLSKIVTATAGALGQLGGTTGNMSIEKTKEAAKAAGDAIKGLFQKKPAEPKPDDTKKP